MKGGILVCIWQMRWLHRQLQQQCIFVQRRLADIPKLDEYYIGQLIYFFEKACGISGLLLEVNPFNQPGVEAYKRNMFALLDKPGYEEDR